MTRTLATVFLALACGVAPAGEPLAAVVHDAQHDADRESDDAVAVRRLQTMLKEIIEKQKEIRPEIHPPHTPPAKVLRPSITAPEQVVVEKGGRAVVEHAISWNQYPHDELEVTLTASDLSLVVPEKLSLDFERHQFRFQYEVQAGDKAGEFTVTLTPKAGKMVEVKVVVK